MKAMVLAAGIGSRLRPLTDTRPKALVEIAGVPLIEIVLRRLVAVGVRDVVVNTHHHAAMLEDWLAQHAGRLGLRVAVSHEDVLLDTGGGLKAAAPHLAGDEPFFLHNADVVSDVDLGRLYAVHAETGALATLSVRGRPSSRQFLFDKHGALCGWERSDTGELQWAGAPVAQPTRLAFDGIQVLSPRIFSALTETGIFSLTRAYLRLAGTGEMIRARRADVGFWADAGSMAKLEAIERHVAAYGLPA